MNLRSLTYLTALADHQHFGKAAKASFVSQPTLSMQIKKLEDELGVQIIERTNKSMRLTTIGKQLIEQARTITRLADEMKKTAQLAQDPYQGELKLGLIPTLAPYLLPHIIRPIAKKFPRITLLLSEEKSAPAFLQLRQGGLDMVLAALMPGETEFVTTPLFTEEFMLATATADPLAKRKFIRLSDLEEQKILLLEDGHCLRVQALEACRNMDKISQQNFQATSLETLRHMVAGGVGITLMPKLAQKKNDGVAYIPFTNPKPSRVVGLFWRKGDARQRLYKEFGEMISAIISDLD